MQNNKIQIALQKFDNKIVDFKNDVKKQLIVILNKGEILYQNNQFNEAISLLKDAIMIKKKYHIALEDIDTAKLYYTIANSYISIEDNKNAYYHLRIGSKILKQNTPEHQFLKIKINVNLGIIYKSFGQNQESLKTLITAREELLNLDYDKKLKEDVLFILNFKIGGSFSINEQNKDIILEHFLPAYEYSVKTKNIKNASIIGNSIINTYCTLGYINESKIFFSEYELYLNKQTKNTLNDTYLLFAKFNLAICNNDLEKSNQILHELKYNKTQNNIAYININYIICLVEYHIALFKNTKSTSNFHKDINQEINQFTQNIEASDYLFYNEPIELILKFYKITKYKNRLTFYDFYIEYLKKSKKTKMELDSLYFQEKYKLEDIQNKLNTQIEYNDKLQEINYSLNNFASIAAHDLKAPLRTISEFSKLLLLKYRKDLKSDDFKLFELIIENASNLNKLIGDLLNFSDIDKNLGEQAPINLNQVFDDIFLKYQNQIKDSNANIQYNELPTVIGHETLISKLLTNIIDNSFKFRKQHIPLLIMISATSDNYDNTTIRIQDNGIGISKNELSKIFEPFKKLHDDNIYEGNGIGLSFCKKIIDFYEQEIWAESDTDHGVTMIFTLKI